MSANTAQRVPSKGRLLRWASSQEALPWVLSLLMHAAMIVVMAFIWIVVVVGPPADKQDEPVRLVAWDYKQLSSGSDASPSRYKDLKTTGALPNPGATAWARTVPLEAFGRPRTGHPDGRTTTVVRIVGGGPDGVFRPPGGSGGAGLVPGGREGPIPPGPARVVYVLDGSGSMLDQLDLVKRRLLVDLSFLTFDQAARQGHHFNIIFFRTKATAFWSGLLPATKANKIAAVKWLRSVYAVGGTNPVPALKMAFQHDPEFIVLLSDGEFDREVVKVVGGFQQRRARPVKIIAIGYGNNFSARNLEELAASSGGRFIRLSEE